MDYIAEEGRGRRHCRLHGGGPKPPSCNVQTAVGADTGLIIHHAVTDEASDNRSLYPMANAARRVVGRDELTVVADAGYSNGADASACEADGITPCVPANRAINSKDDGTLFDRSAFTYEPATDTLLCPAGGLLTRKQVMREKQGVLYAATDRSGCTPKPRCTAAERRLVTRRRHDEALNRTTARVEADPDLMRRRRCAAEHPFGTIKRMTAGGSFLTRDQAGTRTETALSVLAHNILRAVNMRAALA
jgi:transposase